MSNKVIALTKVFLKNSFQNMETADKNKQKTKSMVLLYGFAFLYLAGIVGFFSYSIIKSLMEIQQEQMFIGIILLAIAMFLLIQTIFSAMSLLYYSKDNEYILPLPLKPKQIIMAKTNVILITEYSMVLILGLIPLTIYGVLTSQGALFYISEVVVLALFPIVPVLLANLLILIVMSFSKFARNKNRFQVIATLLIMVIAFGASYLSGSGSTSQEEMLKMVTKANGLVESVENAFPSLSMGINALTGNSITTVLLNLLGLGIFTGILYYLYILVGQKLYLKGAVGTLYSGKKEHKKINENKAFKRRSLAKAYIGKEVKTLTRNSVFFMQCVLPAILFPVIMILVVYMGMQQDGGVSITELANSVSNKASATTGILTLMVIQFFAMFIYISVTAISRDGQNAVFMKYIPVPLEKQINYKVAPNIILMVIMELVIVGIVQYIFRLQILYVILMIIALIALAVIESYLYILVDLKKPKLEWNSEYAVVKQNMNLMWPVIIGIGNAILLYCYRGIIGTNNGYIVIGILAVVYTALAITIRKYIQKNATKLFEKIY